MTRYAWMHNVIFLLFVVSSQCFAAAMLISRSGNGL
jgi:hypothetical protein